eukprot:12416511-Ditylum_brightwellii.AAC.1
MDESVLVGYQGIHCHWVFDIKIDFIREARFEAGGHLTVLPSSLAYSSVVSMETVRIALTVAALNDLYIMAADIGISYLNAPCRKKVYFTAGI